MEQIYIPHATGLKLLIFKAVTVIVWPPKIPWHLGHQLFFHLSAPMVRSKLRAVVVDPEIVFVANLMKADAPALVASFQCDFTLQAEDDGTQNMRSNLRDLKVLACPFICNKEDKAVTTVRPHQLTCIHTKTECNLCRYFFFHVFVACLVNV